MKFQTSSFVKQVKDINGELKRLSNNDLVLNQFIAEFNLDSDELALINSPNQAIKDDFFRVLHKIRTIHEKAKTELASNQYMTG